jgi:hypothetical protein
MTSAGGAVRGATVILLVAAAVAGGLLTVETLTADEPSAAGDEYPGVGDLVAERTAATGEIEVPVANGSGTVLIDDGHHNRQSDEQLRPLVSALSSAGYDVHRVTEGHDLGRQLARADAYVIVDPLRAYEPAEARAVERFADTGGRVVLFAEPTRQIVTDQAVARSKQIRRSRLATLGSHLGIEVGTDYLYNLTENDGNYKRVFAGATRRDADYGRVVLSTATTVRAAEGDSLLQTAAGTRLSGSTGTGPHTVAVKRDHVLAVGDASLLTSGTHRVEDNEAFLERVVRFLVSGDRTGNLAAYPALLGDRPAVSYTETGLLEVAQSVGTHVRSAGGSPQLSFRGVSPDSTDVVVTSYDYLESTDLGTGVDVGDNFVSVGGHSVSRSGTALVAADASGYDLVVAAADPDSAHRAVSALGEENATRYLVSGDLALVTPE